MFLSLVLFYTAKLIIFWIIRKYFGTYFKREFGMSAATAAKVRSKTKNRQYNEAYLGNYIQRIGFQDYD